MENVHKKILRSNHCFLLEHCNFKTLLPKLLENKVFTKTSIPLYEKCDYDSKINVLFHLPTRGPKAFNNFILSLKQSNQTHIVNKLLGIKDVSPVRTHTVPIFPSTPDNFVPLDLRTEKLRIQVVRSDNFKDDFTKALSPYNMRSKSRGAALIINNKSFHLDKPRKGAQVDQENLEELFRQMGGYDVTIQENRTAGQMRNDIVDFSKSNILKMVDVMFLVIMSHGSDYINESQVKCVDEEYIRCHWIESQFSGDNCPHMQNKPKIIIYQICRGMDVDSGIRKTETDGFGLDLPIRTHSDMLICHSTSQGYRAHRDTELGSWYIQYLCEIFMNHSHNDHVATMLHMVDQYLSRLQSDDKNKTMQTSNFLNVGFRLCYLNPGIYEENKQLYHYID